MSIPKEDLHRLIDTNWLNAELADWPPYDWGPEGVPKGKPVRFVEGKGLEIEHKT